MGEEEVGVHVEENKKDNESKNDMIYGVEDIPPWYQSLLLGFQNFLAFAGAGLPAPLIVTGYMCMSDTDPGKGTIVATVIFVSGIITLMQATFGIRLPIIQGSNFAYLVPSISLLATTFPACDTYNLDQLTEQERTEVWQVRMREIQGAITVSSIVQVIIGFTGLEGVFLMIITPITIVTTVALLAFSIGSVCFNQIATHWPIAITHLIVLVLVSQFFNNIKTPFPSCSRKHKCHIKWFPLFTYFSVLFVTLFSWFVCWILTIYNVLTEGSYARTDKSGSLIAQSPWFKIPYPGQWGIMTISVSSVVGMLSSVMASIIESIGDYNACAQTCQVVMPPVHAVCRGSGIEGIGGILAGVFGTATGTASFTNNITLIGMTKVASRRVVQYTGVIMLVIGIFSKLCAVFATIPDPILGSNLLFMSSLIAGIAFSPLRLINLTSTRNLFVLGTSLCVGLALPDWAGRNPQAIQTGIISLDDSIMMLMKTSMFIGGFIALILDNTVPGTAEERGLTNWVYYQQHKSQHSTNHSTIHVYDLPYGMDAIRRWKWTRWIPFLPTFQGFKHSSDDDLTSQQNTTSSTHYIPTTLPSELNNNPITSDL